MTAIAAAGADRAMARAGADIRLFLLYGPDQSRAYQLFQKQAARYGEDAEVIALKSDMLVSDPARLLTEAASSSLFGGARYIRLDIDRQSDSLLEVLAGLLDADIAGTPVLALAGDVGKTTKLLTLVNKHSRAMAIECGAMTMQDFITEARALAQQQHLTLSNDAARHLAQICELDIALGANELAKYALYLNSSATNVAEVTPEVFAAVGAAMMEEDTARLVQWIMSGETKKIAQAFSQMQELAINEFGLLRSLGRYVKGLLAARSAMDGGKSVDFALGVVYGFDKVQAKAVVLRWPSAMLTRLMQRVLTAEEAVKSPGSLGPLHIRQMLTETAYQAVRLAGNSTRNPR